MGEDVLPAETADRSQVTGRSAGDGDGVRPTDRPVEIELGVADAVFDQHGEVFSRRQDGGPVGQREREGGGGSRQPSWRLPARVQRAPSHFGGLLSDSRGHQDSTSHVFCLSEYATHRPVRIPRGSLLT